jgi:hypothetical protein
MPITNTLNWNVVRGDTWSRVFTLRDEQNAVPTGLAGSFITVTVRNQYDTQVLQADTASGEVTADGTTGEVAVAIDDETTDAIEVGQYAYDLEVLSASGVRKTPVLGTLTVRNDVTRS